MWFAAKPPHDLAYPARARAALLDLPDPPGNGARRINEAISWLAEDNLIEVETRAGQPSLVRLLSEAGTKERYELPGAAYNRLRNKKPASLAEAHRYIQLPNELWTNGWMAVLSGAAIAMLLVLYAELGNQKPETTNLWFSPRQADVQYGLSEDTRTKGLRELRAAGLVTARRQSISIDTFDFQRLRNVYLLETHRLHEKAEVPEVIKPPAPLIPSEAELAGRVRFLSASLTSGHPGVQVNPSRGNRPAFRKPSTQERACQRRPNSGSGTHSVIVPGG